MNINIYKVIFLLLIFINLFVIYLFRQRDYKKRSFYPRAARDYFLFHPFFISWKLILTLNCTCIFSFIKNRKWFAVRGYVKGEKDLKQDIMIFLYMCIYMEFFPVLEIFKFVTIFFRLISRRVLKIMPVAVFHEYFFCLFLSKIIVVKSSQLVTYGL